MTQCKLIEQNKDFYFLCSLEENHEPPCISTLAYPKEL